MKFTKDALIVLSSVAVLGIGVAIGVNAFKGEPSLIPSIARKEAKTPVKFSTEEITRRVYFINNDPEWAGWDNLYVHAWSIVDSSNKTESLVTATLLMDDIRGGLYYADVTFAGAGHEIGVIITNSSTWSGLQTVDVSLPALNSDLADIVYMNDGLTDGHRNATAGSFGELSESKAAYLISQYKTCSDAYTDGYNAYPQLVKDFWNLPYVDQSTTVDDYTYEDYIANSESYTGIDKTAAATTIAAKLAGMKSMYDTDGWTVNDYRVPFAFATQKGKVTDEDSEIVDLYVCANEDGVSTITYDRIVDNTYRNVWTNLADVPADAKGITLDFYNYGAESVQINVDMGYDEGGLNSILTRRPGVSEGFTPYDYFEGGRAQYNIGPATGVYSPGLRSLTFYFDQSEHHVEACCMFINSCYSATTNTHLNGSMAIKNAIYIF